MRLRCSGWRRHGNKAPSGISIAAWRDAAIGRIVAPTHYRRLRDDIARHGIRIPIMLFEGKILDGRNRYKAAKECGHVFEPKNFSEFSGSYDDAHAFVVSTNLQGRQLSNAQKQDFIRKMIEKYPALSNRQIAKEKCGGMSHVTVGKVRDSIMRPPERVKFERFSTRMRAAIEAAPYVHPKLSATAILEGGDFAEGLGRAIERSNAARQIEASDVIDAQPSSDDRPARELPPVGPAPPPIDAPFPRHRR